MSTQVQNRRGTTAEHSTFTGAVGELTVDTTKDTVVVHDGSTAGGAPLLREDGSNSALALGSAASPSLKFTGDTNTGIYSPGADQLAISSSGSERIRIGANGEIGIGGANYGTSGQVLTSGGTGAAPSWQTPSAGNTDKIEEGNSSAEVIDTGADGRFVVTTEGSEQLRITSDRYVRLASATGGIQFNGDTAAANALDDYEEGTFTPTIVGTGTAGAGTYTGQLGRYTKVGNRVLFVIRISWTAHTGTGDMVIGALPFTSNNTASNVSSASIICSAVTLTASNVPSAYINPNTTQIVIAQTSTGGGALTSVALDTSAAIFVTGQYETA